MALYDSAAEAARPERLRRAVRLVLRRYWRQVRERPWLALAGMLLPGVGNVFVFYVPPLAIALVLEKLAKNPQGTTADVALPVVLLSTSWLAGEAFWRLTGWFLGRRRSGR